MYNHIICGAPDSDWTRIVVIGICCLIRDWPYAIPNSATNYYYNGSFVLYVVQVLQPEDIVIVIGRPLGGTQLVQKNKQL